MLKARLREDALGRLELQTPYHGELVAWLRTLPSSARSWEPDRKVWIIMTAYADEVLTALQQFQFTVQDDRPGAVVPAQDGAALWAPPGMPAELSQAMYQLGLNGEAPLELAIVAWKFWLKYYHPDINGTGDDAHAKRLNAAMDTIRRYLED